MAEVTFNGSRIGTSKTRENLEANSRGGKMDDSFPDGVGKSGGSGAEITSKDGYDYSQKMAPHFKEIASTMQETAMYGGHGIMARQAGIDIPSDSDKDGDYDTPVPKQPGTNVGGD